MANEASRSQQTSFRYRGRTYQAKEKIRLRGKLYLVVEKWGTRYKAFDRSLQAWRSIRVRKSGVRYEMSLMQFAKLRNSSIPFVFDYFKDDDYEYLVQEWIDGYDLRHFLRRKMEEQPYFTPQRSYDLMLGLVNGLNRLHERNVYHGDIKPENLIVADNKRLVMIDFGAAWSGSQARSRPAQKTRGYASPEQCLREPLVDHRADQFSASVVLYEMLTGDLPYEGRGSFGIDYTHHPLLVPPSRKNKKVWKNLDPVVMKGLSLDKQQRYETSLAWLQEFYAAAQPVSPKTLFARYFPHWEEMKDILNGKHFRSP